MINGLRGRLAPSPSPFAGANCGRLAATVFEVDDFRRKPKIYQLCVPCPVTAFRMSVVVPRTWSLSPSGGAGSYTLPDITREKINHYHKTKESKVSNQSIRTKKPSNLIKRFALPLEIRIKLNKGGKMAKKQCEFCKEKEGNKLHYYIDGRECETYICSECYGKKIRAEMVEDRC